MKQKVKSSMIIVQSNTIKSVIMTDKVYIYAMCLPCQIHRTLVVFRNTSERKSLESPEPSTLRSTTRELQTLYYLPLMLSPPKNHLNRPYPTTISHRRLNLRTTVLLAPLLSVLNLRQSSNHFRHGVSDLDAFHSQSTSRILGKVEEDYEEEVELRG